MICVRDIESWMLSLDRSSYGIGPIQGDRPDSPTDLGWMFEEVAINTLCNNPYPNLIFPNVPNLWACYLNGYLAGHIAPENDSEAPRRRVRVVRFEDLLYDPEEVVNELARLGLPRDGKVFLPIGESVSDAADTRDNILLRETNQRGKISDELRDMIALKLTDASHLVEWLGYGSLQVPAEPAEPTSGIVRNEDRASSSHLQAPTAIARQPVDPTFGIVWNAEWESLYCTLCRHYATPGHLRSDKHRKNIDWAMYDEEWMLKRMSESRHTCESPPDWF